MFVCLGSSARADETPSPRQIQQPPPPTPPEPVKAEPVKAEPIEADAPKPAASKSSGCRVDESGAWPLLGLLGLVIRRRRGS